MRQTVNVTLDAPTFPQAYFHMVSDWISFPHIVILLASILIGIRWLTPSKSDLSHIPTVGGPTYPIFSYYGALKYLFKAQEMTQEGYNKYKGGAFKVPQLFRWQVVVSGQKLIEDLRKARDDELSFAEAINEDLRIKYTLGPAIHSNPYHVSIIRSQLTRNMGALFADVRDEIKDAFNEAVPPTDNWAAVCAHDAIMQIVCRTSNRVFVGAPLCKDKDFRDLNVRFTIDVVKGGAILNIMPSSLRRFAAKYLTNVPTSIERGVRHLGPIIKERYRMMEEHGKDWEGKPNDLLSWLMDEASGNERNVRALVLRVLTVNFAAIHTSSMAFTHALYHLAANPEYFAPLREEVERVVQQEGWTKIALQKMRRVDSFLRESQRFDGLGTISMTRKALKDFTFSDGTRIPAGVFVSAAAQPTHFDEAYYDHPEVFNPWRFSELDCSGGEGRKYEIVSTSAEYMTFGHGKHACPGRFFAAIELKAMMAHLVLNYDAKMENEGVIPEPFWFGDRLAPNPRALVMFRRRLS